MNNKTPNNSFFYHLEYMKYWRFTISILFFYVMTHFWVNLRNIMCVFPKRTTVFPRQTSICTLHIGGKLFTGNINDYCITCVNFICQYEFSRQCFHMLLQITFQRSGSIHRIISIINNKLCCSIS